MLISLIAAMGSNRVIGVDNGLPWRLPADLRRFRQITMGHPVLMGRKTHESIGRPLPGRTNIVLTGQRDYRAEGCCVVHTINEALAACDLADEAMVIGGASFYAQMLERAERMYLTYIHHRFEGDEYFPIFDSSQWQECGREDFGPDAENPFSYSFVRLQRDRSTER